MRTRATGRAGAFRSSASTSRAMCPLDRL
jgi:hypothetical protein